MDKMLVVVFRQSLGGTSMQQASMREAGTRRAGNTHTHANQVFTHTDGGGAAALDRQQGCMGGAAPHAAAQ